MVLETVLSLLVLAAFAIDLAIKVVRLITDGMAKRPSIAI